MRNAAKAIGEGKKAVEKYPKFAIKIDDAMNVVIESNGGDVFKIAENGILFGIAVGMRLEKEKRKAAKGARKE